MKTAQETAELPELSLLDFESACKTVLDFLHQRLGFGLWMITRKVGDKWMVLQADNHVYPIKQGDVFKWNETLCAVMMRGEGPRIVPDTDQFPVYAKAGLNKKLPIKAYIGVPLTDSEGNLFGTLCAFDPDAQSETIVMERQLIELLAALLSSILKLELSATDAQRRTERLEMAAGIDPLTQLSTRSVWEQVLTKEEERCLRYGHSAAILVVDVNGLSTVNQTQGKKAGDELLKRVGEALSGVMREVDLVARLSDDEFAVLAVECNDVGSRALLKRLRQTMKKRQLDVSIGIAVRHTTGGLTTAQQMAERRMYEEKRMHG